ncbi:hypothetical protein [Hydromonas duriensis]|nr:hypothetical protein [Hydromonas duriensis]
MHKRIRELEIQNKHFKLKSDTLNIQYEKFDSEEAGFRRMIKKMREISARNMLKYQHIYCYKALRHSDYFEFVCSLYDTTELPDDKHFVTEEHLCKSELWDTGYCTMCEVPHTHDVIDVGLLILLKSFYESQQIALKNITFEFWVSRIIGIRVRKTATDFETLGLKLFNQTPFKGKGE